MTNEELQAHLKSGRSAYEHTDLPIRMPCDHIECADGFVVSIQANSTAYSKPRDIDGPYTHVELGYPSLEDELITAWAEDPEDLTGTVYPYVPIETALELIKKHGGRRQEDQTA